MERKNQHPGVKTSMEITSGTGEKKRREVGKVEVGRCSAMLGTSWLLEGVKIAGWGSGNLR